MKVIPQHQIPPAEAFYTDEQSSPSRVEDYTGWAYVTGEPGDAVDTFQTSVGRLVAVPYGSWLVFPAGPTGGYQIILDEWFKVWYREV